MMTIEEILKKRVNQIAMAVKSNGMLYASFDWFMPDDDTLSFREKLHNLRFFWRALLKLKSLNIKCFPIGNDIVFFMK